MKKRTIVLNSNDMPSFKAIVESISRLRKDYVLLAKFRGSKDIEDPVSFKSVISFLEMLAKREKRSIPKDKAFVDNHMEVMMEMVAEHVMAMEDWEAHRTIDETGLMKVFERVKARIKEIKPKKEEEEDG